MEPIHVLDLFAGLRGWSEAWKERGHDVRTLDLDRRFDVTYHTDILTFEPSDLGDWRPDVVLASPPCEGFTVMNIGKNWTRPTDDPPHQPKTDSARLALAIVERTRWLISELTPAFFVIENPRAKLRVLPPVADLTRHTVWYCHYDETNAKPTDLWGGFPLTWVPEPECHNAVPDHPLNCCCRDHAGAPRGSRTPGSVQGVKGKDSDAVRAKVPTALSLALCYAAEHDIAHGGRARPISASPVTERPTTLF